MRRIYRFALAERPRLRLRATTNAVRGHLHPERDAHVRGPYLDMFASMLAPKVGVDHTSLRMVIQTMTFLTMQYVLLNDAELEQIVGFSGDAGRKSVEDHLVLVALRLVFTA